MKTREWFYGMADNKGFIWSFPRTRGGDPSNDGGNANFIGFSPHTRG